MLKKQQITHGCIETGFGKNIGGRSNEKNLGPLAVKGVIDLDSSQILNIISEEVNVILEGMGL